MIKRLWNRFHFFIILALIGIAIGVALNVYAVSQSAKQSSDTLNSKQGLATQISPTSKVSAESPLSSKTNQALSDKSKLGHFPFAEGDYNQMLTIASYATGEYQRFERLAPDAALALLKLIYTARNDGVWIVPVSGFRNISDQEKLFDAQIQRRGSPEAAAKLSAPPGYSEHHTGYAIDVTDGRFPKQDITYNFATTEAFKWLTIHAKEFGFEMSFPENNSQGVSYEPWHWRFVSSNEAKEIFKNRS
ncbi:MAG: M15 family metallopeptidase [Pseudanabaena sp. ELA645]|jgi:D-alanyl-D-alanine carboxypeptidase